MADFTKRLGLAQEIQLDAREMVRRAEYTLGKAIRQGQAEGLIETPQEASRRATLTREVNQGRADPVRLTDSIKPKPTDYASARELSGGRGGDGIYAITDGVTDCLDDSSDDAEDDS